MSFGDGIRLLIHGVDDWHVVRIYVERDCFEEMAEVSYCCIDGEELPVEGVVALFRW